MDATDLARLLLALAVIVAAARLFGLVVRTVGQPAVVGEIIAGILLGPTLAGGAHTSALFPAAIRPDLTDLSEVGVCVFVFFIGLHFERRLLDGQARVTATVSIAAMLVPFALGTCLAVGIVGGQDHRLAFVLFFATAMSITAFPVLARMLSDSRLVKTRVGAVALACAAVDDVIAWSLLAVVTAVAGASNNAWRPALVLPFAFVLLVVIRPVLVAVSRRRQLGRAGGWAGLVLAAAALFGCSFATDTMGLQPIFGAFLLGMSLPRGLVTGHFEFLLKRWEQMSSMVLLPVFFLTVGLKVDLSNIGAGQLGLFVLVLAVAVGGKGGGAFLGARLTRASRRDSAVLGVLLNARGLTELIALTVGLQLGLLDRRLYSLMVLMAVVTTVMTGVMLRVLYPARRVDAEIAATTPWAEVAA